MQHIVADLPFAPDADEFLALGVHRGMPEPPGEHGVLLRYRRVPIAGRIGAEFAEKNAIADLSTPDSENHAVLARRLRHAAVNAERHELIRIWRESQISDDVLHEFEEKLDYKESNL